MSPTKSNRKVVSTVSRRTARRRNTRVNSRRLGIRMTPAPVTIGFSGKAYSTIKQTAAGAYVKCREIFHISKFTDGLAFQLPLCPSKWIGTRTNQLCSCFTDFRPLSLKLHWMPDCPTTTAGTIAVGTVFSGSSLPSTTSYNELSKFCTISNGGYITTAWKPYSSSVSLKTHLRANNFPMLDVDPDDIPLWIIVASDVTTPDNLGYLYVDAEFALKNPVVGTAQAPVSFMKRVAITHEDASGDTPATTKFVVPQNEIQGLVNPGTEVLVTPGVSLQNTSNQVIIKPLQYLVAKATQIAEGAVTFFIDSAIKSVTSCPLTAIGYSPNSFLG